MRSRKPRESRIRVRLGHLALVLVATLLSAMAAAASPGIVQPPLGTDALRRQAIDQPHQLIRQIRAHLDHARTPLDPVNERGLMWWMGSAALNVNDDAALTESVLRLDSLASVHHDPLAAAAGGFLRAFQDLLAGDGKGLPEALRAASRVQDTDDPKVAAWARYELCDAYTQAGKPGKALPLCHKAAAAARQVGDAWELADDENDIAWNLSALHHYAQAVPLYKRSRRRFKRIGADQVAAQIGDNLAHTLILLGRPREAIKLSRASLVHEQAAGRNSDALLSRANIARAYAALGKPRKAEQLINATIDDASKTGNTYLLADFYAADSRFAEAAGDLHKALRSARLVSHWLRAQRKPALLSSERTLEHRYQVRERELRIRELERENRDKDLALKVAQARAEQQTEAERRQQLRTTIAFVIAIAMIVAATLLVLLLRAQRRYASTLRQQALRDPLTGIDNRRAFMLEAQRLINEETCTAGHEHALLLIDLDHFKRVNDSAGHPMGDRVLAMVVNHLSRASHHYGTVSRLGGEEFAILCPCIGAGAAFREARALCDGVASLSLPEASPVRKVTISMGVAMLDGDRCRDVDSWMHEADHALYRAKDEGRNRVVMADHVVHASHGMGIDPATL